MRFSLQRIAHSTLRSVHWSHQAVTLKLSFLRKSLWSIKVCLRLHLLFQLTGSEFYMTRNHWRNNQQILSREYQNRHRRLVLFCICKYRYQRFLLRHLTTTPFRETTFATSRSHRLFKVQLILFIFVVLQFSMVLINETWSRFGSIFY